MSNSDAIREMTDEELTWLFVNGCLGRACPSYAINSHTEEEAETHCRECWLEWLKEEVKT